MVMNYGNEFRKYLHASWSLQYPYDFWHERKIYNFDPYNVLAIATNIPMQFKTGFGVQGQICVLKHF